MALADMRPPIESGCPDGFQYMHPVMVKNYGNWKYHEHPRPGVLLHVAHSGEKIWTVKAGTQRILDIFTLRKLCEIGDSTATATSASPALEHRVHGADEPRSSR
jgi:dissimilatory sulfite reductase beta subunit